MFDINEIGLEFCFKETKKKFIQWMNDGCDFYYGNNDDDDDRIKIRYYSTQKHSSYILLLVGSWIKFNF